MFNTHIDIHALQGYEICINVQGYLLIVQGKCTKCTKVYKATVSPLATWFRPGEIGLMGRPCTHESLGGKQGKPGGLVVQTPGAKCGDRGQVKRALRIGVTKGSGHVC